MYRGVGVRNARNALCQLSAVVLKGNNTTIASDSKSEWAETADHDQRDHGEVTHRSSNRTSSAIRITLLNTHYPVCRKRTEQLHQFNILRSRKLFK